MSASAVMRRLAPVRTALKGAARRFALRPSSAAPRGQFAQRAGEGVVPGAYPVHGHQRGVMRHLADASCANSPSARARRREIRPSRSALRGVQRTTLVRF